MRANTFLLAILLSVYCLSGNAQIEDRPALLQNISIKSKILNEERELRIFLPDDYNTSNISYPALYLLDGRTHFRHVTSAVAFLRNNNKIPGIIVVAIVNTDRTRDFSPVHVEQFPTSGGAGNFLGFLSSELTPFIDGNYRTSGFNMLLGHSFGGTFAAYALIERPELFDAYIAISPYLQYADHHLVSRAENELKPFSGIGKYFYMTVGNEPDYFEGLKSFASAMGQKAEGTIAFKYLRMEDEDHASIPYITAFNGIRFIFSEWELPREKLEMGLEVVDAHYAKISRKYGIEMQAPENLLNLVGYTFLQNYDIQTAISVFYENVKRYPGSANVYDSLGEAYENNSQIKLAKENYRKAYELGTKLNDPNTPVYKTNLDRVSGK